MDSVLADREIIEVAKSSADGISTNNGRGRLNRLDGARPNDKPMAVRVIIRLDDDVVSGMREATEPEWSV